MQVRAMMLRLGLGIALIAASAVAIAQDSPAAQDERRILNEAEANRGAAQIAEQEARQKAAAEQQAARDADCAAAIGGRGEPMQGRRSHPVRSRHAAESDPARDASALSGRAESI